MDVTTRLREITDISNDEMEMVHSLGVEQDIERAARDIVNGHSVEDVISRYELPRFRDMKTILGAVKQRDLEARAVCAVTHGDMDEATASALYGIDANTLKALVSRERDPENPTIATALEGVHADVENGMPASMAIRKYDIQAPRLRRKLFYLERRVKLNKLAVIMRDGNLPAAPLARAHSVIHPAEIAEFEHLRKTLTPNGNSGGADLSCVPQEVSRLVSNHPPSLVRTHRVDQPLGGTGQRIDEI
ncbi:hypothetical protein [Paraburkholderia sediminicola]|uniref:hypothetical protein n=1 Tax=Paraburkholderia sediminicola TaxID=458836 RepID=UPI0038B88F23